MKVLLSATPVSGHLNPVLNIGNILKEAGFDVLVMTAHTLRSRVEAAGLNFTATSTADDRDWIDIDATFPERATHAPGFDQLLFDCKHGFLDSMPGQFSGLMAVLEHFPADAIITDSTYTGILPFLLGARAARPAIVAISPVPLFYRRDDGAPNGPGLPPAVSAEQTAQYAALAEGAHQALFGPAWEYANALLGSLGARPLPMIWPDVTVVLADAFLVPTIPSFEYPRQDLPATIRFVGALPHAEQPLPPELKAVIESGKKLVLVTQGTVSNTDLSQLVEPALAALAHREDVMVLATTGGRDTSVITVRIPANASVSRWLPLDQVLPHACAMITNCGYGTVNSALAYGVPIVGAGLSEDKPEVAARIAWSGVGIDLKTDRPTVEQLRDAANALLDEPRFYQRAQEIAREYRAFNASALIPHIIKETVAAHVAAH